MYNEKSEIKNIALYTRVSTEEQARGGFSLDAQLDRLRSYCKAKEWEIIGEYIDPGYSGRNTRRPMYQKMFEDIDMWDGILILKMDRIHRKVRNALAMFEILEKKSKHFISFMENIDTSTAMGRAMMTITLVFAQLESEQLGERIVIGLTQKAKQAEEFMGHRVPFGYQWDSKKHRFIPIKEELEIVKKTFDLYLLKEGIDPIIETKDGWINEITDKKIDGKEIKRLKTRYTKHGHSFRSIAKIIGKPHSTVKYYLNNIFYTGYERYIHYFRKINDGFEPVISKDQWNEAQKKMRLFSRSKNYKPLLIPDDQPELFKLSHEQIKTIPVINRAKHNFNF